MEMDNRCAHIIYTPFTGVGLHGGFRGDKWFAHRIEIFKKYTLKSLLNQSNKGFLHWFSFRPEEEGHPLVLELAKYLKSLNYPFVMTFYGLMYHDDKFTNYNLKTALRNFLMMLWDLWHYKEWKGFKNLWKYTWENKNKTLLIRLEKSLEIIKQTIGYQYDWVYLTRIDSDDMFHREAVNLIQNEKPEYRRALVFDKGYIYNIQTGQVATWNPPTNPPFHTIIFPASIFFDSLAHKEYYGVFRSHEDIPKVFNPVTLDINKYMVSFHGKHISTAWDSPLLKKAYHKAKYGSTEPFKGYDTKGYCYTTSGRNISTHWQSRTRKVKNLMIGEEFGEDEKVLILADFGIE